MSAGGQVIDGSYVTPSMRHARVSDAMRPVHAVVVRGVGESGRRGVVTDRDLLATALGAEDAQAGDCASEVLLGVVSTLDIAGIVARGQA
jgi:hypothetical protein